MEVAQLLCVSCQTIPTEVKARCVHNSCKCNAAKMVEMFVDFHKLPSTIKPLATNVLAVSKLGSFRILVISITNPMTWVNNITTILEKAQQRLFFQFQCRKPSISTHPERKLVCSPLSSQSRFPLLLISSRPDCNKWSTFLRSAVSPPK